MTPVMARYDPDLGQFLRTFNVRYRRAGLVFELPIQATSWADAEAIVNAVAASGVVHSELVAVEAG